MIPLSTLTRRWFVPVCLFTVTLAMDPCSAQSTDREKILNSDEWKNTMHDLEEWSSVQKIYDADQMAKLKQDLKKKVEGMSADQLKSFLSDLKQKLAILNSGEARKARAWLDESLAVAAPAYAKKIRARLPDIASLTAAQLQEQLDLYQDQIEAKRQYAADFAKEREEQAKQIREQRIRDQRARLFSELEGSAVPRSSYNFSTPTVIRSYAPAYPPAYPLYGGFRW